MRPLPTIAVLGAAGLIGEATASWLLREGFPVVAVARRFNAVQRAAFAGFSIECPIVDLDALALAQIFSEYKIEIVVNCIGILQDGGSGSTDAVHRAFVERLLAALASLEKPSLLVHLSIPGHGATDRTPFSQTKRAAEHLIEASDVASIILRPGFVIAPSAYGGGAAMRALAMLPFDLPAGLSHQPFMTTDVDDISRTVAFAADRWAQGQRTWKTTWDVMAPQKMSVGKVIEAFRWHLGGRKPLLRLPSALMNLGAAASDIASWLGWSSPLRGTALAEMRRGVAGDPVVWMEATGIAPLSLVKALQKTPASVQDKWFGRLYFAKALILASLSLFWIVSGVVALTHGFSGALLILTLHGFPLDAAKLFTVATSLADLLIGSAIAFKRTCGLGLKVGIAVSLLYLTGSVVLMPELWLDPLGCLVKTGPAIVLMLVGLALLEAR